MLKSLLRLWLAVFLIAVASAVLLLTDREHKRGDSHGASKGDGSAGKVRSVALLQHVSQETLEEGVRGVLAALAENGYEDGRTLQLRRYNAEGDAPTAVTIARAIIGSDAELVITLSTPSLQAVAAANRDFKRPHVFGMVSDPPGAGVGIARDDPMKHPPYMVGLGTMQPVAETFRMARTVAPRLARVGAPWNPSEANSEAGMKVARSVCKELGIELLEATVDGSGAVREAVASLVGRGAEAIYIGGDNTVLASLDAVIGPAVLRARAGLFEHSRLRRSRLVVRLGRRLSPRRPVDRPARRSRAGGSIACRDANSLRSSTRDLDQPARTRGPDGGLVVSPRHRGQQADVVVEERGPVEAPPAQGRRGTSTVAHLEARTGRTQ